MEDIKERLPQEEQPIYCENENIHKNNALISYYLAPITNILPSKEISLEDIYNLIVGNVLKEATEKVRNGSALKTEILPYITPSGTFSKRKDSSLKSYSGKICIDLDHCDIGIKDTLSGDPFLNPALIHVSPSNNGLKMTIVINDAIVENHIRHFEAIAKYLFDTYELIVDKSGKDISRACFLCHDSEAYFSCGSIDSNILLSILPKPTVQAKIIPLNYQKPSEELNRLSIIHARAISALISNGWHIDGEHCTRPDKDPKNGISAKYNIDTDGLFKFTNFSENGYPFAVKGYTDVQVICELEFNGRFDDCIKELSREYLSPKITRETAPKSLQIANLPINGFPSHVQNMIVECAKIFGTPQDYWAATAIIATALGIGDKVQLATKFKNVPILWMNIIGDVSSGKTEAMSFLFKIFEDLDKKSVEKYKVDYLAYEEFLKLTVKEKKVVTPILKPVCFQYIVKDATPEALSLIHSVNQRGLAIVRDELKGWLDDFGRYAKSGEQSNMLSSYNRVSMVTNRKGGGSDSVLIIAKPCILVFGGMQPDLIPTLAADNREENGFLARFCNVWPDHADKPTYNKNIVPLDLVNKWNDYITTLINLPQRDDITLSEEAEILYANWFNKNSTISNNEKSGYLKGIFGKLDIIALRLSIVIYGMNGLHNNQISGQEMQTALDITEYFRSTALKVYHKLFDSRNGGTDKKGVILFLSESGRSQSEIAKTVGVSQPYVNKILNASGNRIGIG